MHLLVNIYFFLTYKNFFINNKFNNKAGWGVTSSGGSQPINLNNVKLTVYDSTRCSNVGASIQHNWNAQICAGIFFN